MGTGVIEMQLDWKLVGAQLVGALIFSGMRRWWDEQRVYSRA